ncbi:MAG TPA: sulfotransferase family protein, partial [Myxococcota bacterium]|nr:sulfotransferase family protein [Myxococcota bacterium]
MHRSATSAWTRLLALQGAALPATLIAPAFDNPRGFWESRAIADFNDELLESLGADWALPLPRADLIDRACVDRHLDAAVALLRQEFDTAPIFALKDPRICRMWPLWGRALEALGVEATFVHPLRHPAEVAESLAKRNKLQPSDAHVLWLEHVLAAERASRGAPRVFVTYEQLLGDWAAASGRIVEALALPWDGPSPAIRREAKQFVSK